MAGDNGILESSQAVSARISEFAAKLRTINDELSGRIDSVAGSGAWIGPAAPTDTERYKVWVRVTDTDTDLYYNLGTPEVPDWVSVLRTTKASTIKGVPFKTSERVGTRVVWAVDVDTGWLPNNTAKMTMIPSEVTSEWGLVNERWLDPSNSYAYETGSGTVLPLPYNLLVEEAPDVPEWDKDAVYLEGDIVIRKGDAYQANWYNQDVKPDKNDGEWEAWTNLGPPSAANIPMVYDINDSAEVFLKNSSVHIRTTSNKSGYRGVVRIKYLKAV